jgi:hypothetical protein
LERAYKEVEESKVAVEAAKKRQALDSDIHIKRSETLNASREAPSMPCEERVNVAKAQAKEAELGVKEVLEMYAKDRDALMDEAEAYAAAARSADVAAKGAESGEEASIAAAAKTRCNDEMHRDIRKMVQATLVKATERIHSVSAEKTEPAHFTMTEHTEALHNAAEAEAAHTTQKLAAADTPQKVEENKGPSVEALALEAVANSETAQALAKVTKEKFQEYSERSQKTAEKMRDQAEQANQQAPAAEAKNAKAAAATEMDEATVALRASAAAAKDTLEASQALAEAQRLVLETKTLLCRAKEREEKQKGKPCIR